MGASTRRLAGILSGIAGALLMAAAPVAARSEPGPPWGDPGLAILALLLLPVSALLAAGVSRRHRRRA